MTNRFRRQSGASDTESEAEAGMLGEDFIDDKKHKASWQRILLLIIAITVHNIPGKNNHMFIQFRVA